MRHLCYCLDCDNYDKENHNCPRYCEVIREAIKSRPQGEWIEYKEDDEIRYYCSNCMVTKGQAVNNFCACCGADMRGANNG